MLRNICHVIRAFVVELHADAESLARPQLAVVKIEALRQVGWRSGKTAILHQHRAGKSSQNMSQRGGGDGSCGVRNQTHGMRLAECRDLHELRNAAGVRQSDSGVIDGLLLNQSIDVPTVAILLAYRESAL